MKSGLAVGVDIVKIPRFVRLLENQRFVGRVFTRDEAAHIFRGGRPRAESAAGIFAAKEAFFKAVGSGLVLPALKCAEVRRESSGAPFLALSGALAHYSDEFDFSLSISHDGDYAVAAVVAMKKAG